LGKALRQAGCSYGMHLDMNPAHTGFVFMDVLNPFKQKAQLRIADAGMKISIDKYLRGAPKDFFYVMVRDAAPPKQEGLSWTPDAGAQPPPKWMTGIFGATSPIGSVEVQLLRFEKGHVAFRLRSGSKEPGAWGAAGVKLTHTSPDGDEGFPGTLSVKVVYTFNDRGELAIDYEAATDKPTVVNLTNHSYFNLGGEGSGDVLGHVLTLNADRYTRVDRQLIPTGELADVAGTPLDFRAGTTIGARIHDAAIIELAKGYDHNFVVNRSGVGEVKAAEVFDPRSGRVLQVFTTEPGVQLYLANHQSGKVGKSGHVYDQYGAFCLETQHYPDSPNKPEFPSTLLRPGEIYKSRSVYAFSVR
jgi:galactose mutarotase-like enzyme